MTDEQQEKKKRRRRKLAEIEITGVLAERMDDRGRRRIKLRAHERDAFERSAMIEKAVALFLDTRSDHSWDQIAQALGISVMALKDLTKSQAFMDKYDEHFAELGHDPRLKGAQAALVDLLPKAVRELSLLLSSGDTPPSVKMKAIEKILELNGIRPNKGGEMDRAELMEFLKSANITINQQQNNYLPPFEKNISAYAEGRWEDIEAHPAAERAMIERQGDRDGPEPMEVME